MLHEDAQADIIREDGLASCGSVGGVMRDRWIQHGKKKSRLRFVLVAYDVARNRKSVLHDQLGIVLRSLEQIAEARVLILMLEALLLPCCNRLAVENDDMEKGIQKEDSVGSHRSCIQQHWGGRTMEGVRQKRRLQHDQRVRGVFSQQNMTIQSLLIWRAVERLQKLRSAQMEHELRINCKFRRQTETGRIILAVSGKLRTQSDQTSIDPSHHVCNIIRLTFVNSKTRHQRRRGLLIKSLCQWRATWINVPSGS